MQMNNNVPLALHQNDIKVKQPRVESSADKTKNGNADKLSVFNWIRIDREPTVDVVGAGFIVFLYAL